MSEEKKGPLEGFDAAYDLAVSGDYGWPGVSSKEAFEKILDVKNRATALKQPATTYDHQAVASDLLRAIRSLDIDTPELALKALQTQKELCSGLDGSGHHYSFPEVRLAEYNKTARYLGDEKIAKAYLEAALPEMEKLDKNDLQDGRALRTKAKFAEIATLHPNLASAAQKFPLSPEEKRVLEEEKNRRDESLYAQYAQLQKGKSSGRPFEQKNIKDKAKDFIIGSKLYSAGSKLFDRCKKTALDAWNKPLATFKDIYKANMDVVHQNPKKAAFVGAAFMIAGMETANPAMAAAGASVMTAGLCNLKNKDDKAKSNTEVMTQVKNVFMSKQGR